MSTIKQVKNELRHKRWAKEIAECQSSGMRISEWCQIMYAKIKLSQLGSK